MKTCQLTISPSGLTFSTDTAGDETELRDHQNPPEHHSESVLSKLPKLSGKSYSVDDNDATPQAFKLQGRDGRERVLSVMNTLWPVVIPLE